MATPQSMTPAPALPATIFYDSDADLADLNGETVALIGYGIQGRAQAHNLRDSGVNVIIGNRDDEFRARAVADGFEAFEIDEATRRADVLVMLIPDEVQAKVYRTQIEPNLKPGACIVFAHGFAIRYGLIEPNAQTDVVLVSPRMPGGYLRDFFLKGDGVPVFVDVHQDATGRAWKRTLALAKAVGGTRPGAMKISFAEETELDHFAEHYIYPLVFGALEQAYKVLINNGFTPEAVIMELYGSRELGEVLVTAAKVGLWNMMDQNASPACQYGVHKYEAQLFDQNSEAQVQRIIDEIRDGSFAEELIDDQEHGHPRLKQMVAEAKTRPMTQTESTVRDRIRFKVW